MNGHLWRHWLPLKFYFVRLTLACILLLGASPVLAAPRAAPDAVVVNSYYWTAGTFLNFRNLKQAQKERLLSEMETKLADCRRSGSNLFIRGELMTKIDPATPAFNPATILDQSGLIAIVYNFPNIYYQLTTPETLLRRNTAFVLKDPQLDRAESILRQAVVLRGEFYGFSEEYLKAVAEALTKAAIPTNPALTLEPHPKVQKAPPNRKR